MARVGENGDVLRRPRQQRGDEGELVAEIEWVLDDADDGPPPPVVIERPPSLHVPELRHTLGEGDLSRPGRVAATLEPEEVAAVGPIRLLRAEVHRLDAAGHGHLAVADDVRRPERLVGRRQGCLERLRIGAVEQEQPAGRAELAVERRARVVDENGASDRGRDRDREERHHQHLLTPLAAEHAPRPADDRAAGGNAAVARASPRRVVSERRHRRSAAARSDSGRLVPRLVDHAAARRKTTRSAQEARCASCVTTTPATPRCVAARSRRMTASPFTESSAPVGSSASSTRARRRSPGRSQRAGAHPRTARRGSDRRGRHVELLHRLDTRRARGFGADAVELEGQGDVLDRGQPGEQVEVLEDVADRPASHPSLVRARDIREVDPVHEHLAAGRLLEAAAIVKSVLLPEPLGPMIATSSPRSTVRST